MREPRGVKSEGITESCVKAERRKLRGAGYVCTEVVVDTVYMEMFFPAKVGVKCTTRWYVHNLRKHWQIIPSMAQFIATRKYSYSRKHAPSAKAKSTLYMQVACIGSV